MCDNYLPAHYHCGHPMPMHSYSYHPYLYWQAPCMPYYYYCPACYQPYYQCTCESKSVLINLQEVFADPSAPTQEALIGGIKDVQLKLEYMPAEGAASPSVKVTITNSDGTTSTWDESSIPSGYHMKNDFVKTTPGTKVKIEVNEAIARLRWCETIEC